MTIAGDAAQINADAAIFHGFVNGPSGTTVATDSGPVPTISEAIYRLAGGTQRGAWITSTEYAINDVVTNAGSIYVCTAAHTGGTFATDLSAGKWQQRGTQITDPATAATQVAPFLFSGYRNLLINARGTINQRGYVSGTATGGANQYTLDRWRVVTSGQSLTFTASGNSTQMTAPAGGLEQVIEGEIIYGGSHAISWIGTATCTVNGVTRAKGDTFTLTAGSNCTVRFIGGTVTNPQLERGTVSGQFEQRPIGLELMLCQRYYEKSFNIGTTPAANNGTDGASMATSSGTGTFAVLMSIEYKVTKREGASPAITLFNPWGAGNSMGRYTDNASISTSIYSMNGLRGFNANNNSATIDSVLHAMHWTCDAEI